LASLNVLNLANNSHKQDAQHLTNNEAKRHVTELALDELVDFWVGDAADYLKETQETFIKRFKSGQ
jgi:hypothetical protein